MRDRGLSASRVTRALLALAAVLAIGTVGFVLVDDESVGSAVYRTLITVSTAGLINPPATNGARALTGVLVVLGVAIFLYVFGLLIELIVSGTLSGAVSERRIRRRVEELAGHYVVCGYGRMGRRVAEELRAANAPYVIVDNNPAVVARALEDGHLALEGNATDDATLEAVGIERARGLVAVSGSDAENLYIVVNARELHPELMIVARASTDDAAKNLRRGGADHTVSPYAIAGREVATMMLKPHVAALLDVVTGAGATGLRLEQIVVTSTCDQVGSTVREISVRERTGAIIVAHRRRDGPFTTKLDPNLSLEEGDVLIGVGAEEEIRALEELSRPRKSVA